MTYKSFGFTDHQLMIRDAIIGLMERELPLEKIEELEKASAYPDEAFQVLAMEGWLGLPYPEELAARMHPIRTWRCLSRRLPMCIPGSLPVHDHGDLWRDAIGAKRQ